MKIGFFGLLGLLFIGLKLGAVIDWSWWWVLSPLWGLPALAGIFLIVAWMIGIGEGLTKKGGRP